MNPPDCKLNIQAYPTRMTKHSARLKAKRDRMSAHRQCRRQIIKKYQEEHGKDLSRSPKALSIHIKGCFGSAEAQTKWDNLANEALSSLEAIGPLSRPFEKAKDREEDGIGGRQVLEKQHEEVGQDQARSPRVPDMWSGFCNSYFGAGMRERNAGRPAPAQHFDIAVPERYQIDEALDSMRDEMQKKKNIMCSSESSDSVKDTSGPKNNTIEPPERTKEQKPSVKRPRWEFSDKSNFVENMGFEYGDVNNQHTSRKRKIGSPHSKTHLQSPPTTDSEYDGDTDSVTGEDHAFQPSSKRVKHSSGSPTSHYNEGTVIESRIPPPSARCDERKRKVHFSDETKTSQQRRKLRESYRISGVMMVVSQTSLDPSLHEKTEYAERSRSPPMDRWNVDSSTQSCWCRNRTQRPSNALAAPSLVAHHYCKTCATGPCGSHPEKKVLRSITAQTGAKEDKKSSSCAD